MRSLLSHNLIKNITKSVKSNPNCHFDGYDECSTDTIDKLRETQCINLDDSDAFIFNPPVSVKDLNGATTEEVYVISGGCYLISGISQQIFFDKAMSSLETLAEQVTVTYDSYFISKQDAELNLKLDYDIKLEGSHAKGTETFGAFYVYNPKTFSAQADVGDKVLHSEVEPESVGVLSKDKPKISGAIASNFVLDPNINPESGETGYSGSDSLTITISGEDPGDFPQKSWKIAPNKLYTKDTPDDEFPGNTLENGAPSSPEGNGLSGGEIAGIVIACVVVVGVVVFCIVWFVVLKKSCGKKSDEPAA